MSGVLQRRGVAAAEVIAELDERAAGDADWRTGKMLMGLYDPGPGAHEVALAAYTRFLAQNALYINMYPSIARMEQEVVASVADLLRSDGEVVGNITSGGTESILMAVKASRDWARANRPHITQPRIVVPITAHPAFHKAAHYLGLRVVVTPVDTTGFRADLEAFEKALGPDVILAVGSAPNFSHGTIDPIARMAAAARERGVLFHVDGCVGGIYLSVMRRMGEKLPDFDFSVEGVTSISADLHKYGYSPKNASVVLYRNRDLRRHAIFVCSGTTEYAVINPTAQSSRTGGPVAAAWAILKHLGEEGFQQIVRDSQAATMRMLEGIEEIDGIHVLGDPEMCMFTLASDEVNIFEVDDEMRERGWRLLPQFACGGGPANLHVGISHGNVPHTEQFLTDLADVVGNLRRSGSSLDRSELAAAVAEVRDAPLEAILMRIAPLAGLSGPDLPRRMAALNTMLDLLPAARRDELLTAYVNMTT
ncbi:MAG TPA: aspartate aminotransferase family protein [Candidatus Limnocylindrales bacterium]|nr:aspartate aminotransferase family protein [Candidatus Limnocylindrales bacterium]